MQPHRLHETRDFKATDDRDNKKWQPWTLNTKPMIALAHYEQPIITVSWSEMFQESSMAT